MRWRLVVFWLTNFQIVDGTAVMQALQSSGDPLNGPVQWAVANIQTAFCGLVLVALAIDAVDAWAPDQGRIGCAILHEDRCLAFLETNSCGICVDACPYEALSFDAGRRPVVDETACNGCGECVKICPANVFTSFSGGKARGIEVVTETTFRSRSDA